MKKLFTLFALCTLTLAANATTYNYLCGITDLTVDTLQSTTKNQYTITFSQKCKNTAEYTSKPETFYTSTVKIVLNSDDRTLEGVYTTEGASRTSNSANINDQTINMINTEFTSGSTSRVLYKDENYVSRFVINKEADGSYSIGECTLYFSQRLNQTNIYVYKYSYDAEHILEQGISQTPFVFGYTGEYVTAVYNYDMTVNGVNVTRDNSDYEAIRYFLSNISYDEAAATAEVERYMAMPGQALSYKIGSLKIRSLRDQYQKQLGAKFSLAKFHDEILNQGCLPLDVLDRKMQLWAKRQ